MKKLDQLHDLLKDPEYTEKIQISFPVLTAGADYDPESRNYTSANLAPHTIRGIVTEVTSTSLVWKQYGLSESGAVEVVTEDKYKTWFEKASRIRIYSTDYAVYREGTGNRAIIKRLPNKLIRVTLSKKESK